MYAVIETGGKQHKVELGDELAVELLDVEPGQEIDLERVLLVADGEKTAIGQPIVADATVSARVLRRDRGEKTISFKYRPKARSRVKKGHRQELTVLKIIEVRLGDKSAAAEAHEAQEKAEAERSKIAKAAARQAAEDAALADKLKARAKAAADEAAKTAPKAAKTAPKAEKPAAKTDKAAAREAAPAAEKPAAKAPKAKAEKADAGEAPAKRPARTKKDE
jgi:large subunit ribosomal protein L21